MDNEVAEPQVGKPQNYNIIFIKAIFSLQREPLHFHINVENLPAPAAEVVQSIKKVIVK